MELESVLAGLAATPEERADVYACLTDQRSIRLIRSAERAQGVPNIMLGPLPGIGDLLRAMRIRRGWTQEQLLERMGVSRATAIRWESTRTLPSEEDMARLCLLLRATQEEQHALKARRLSPFGWSPQLSLEECIEQHERLTRIRGGDGSLMPMADLHALALKRQVRSLVNQSPEALRLLAQIEVQHGWWLFMQGRMAESSEASWRALNLVRGRFAPEDFWMRALNLLSVLAARSTRRAENSVRMLYPWLRLLPASQHSVLFCDMAFYAGQAQRHEEATLFLQRARKALLARNGADVGAHWTLHYLELTTGRVLLSAGKPFEAMSYLPAPNSVGDGHVHELLIWAEAHLAAGEKGLASGYLQEAQVALEASPLPQRQARLNQLARLL